MYITKFKTVDGFTENYCYLTAEEATKHMELFRDDDSGLYTEITVEDEDGNVYGKIEFQEA